MNSPLETQASLFEDGTDSAAEYSDPVSYTGILLTQGKHRFYSLAMPSEILAKTCIVEPRSRNPLEGFQRLLDERRAREIADYIDSGFGTIPSAIILSAQPDAQLQYVRKTRTLKFNITPRSFLIIDGQHRVFGFAMARSTLRVPVVIYAGLNRAEECRIFMDVNTKQRPVPNELLLDIKRLAETETDVEALMKDVFDFFNEDAASPLFGLMSPTDRRQGKISRVTFNAAIKQVLPTFADNDAEAVYAILSAYLHAFVAGLRTHDAEAKITNRTMFRALMMLFPLVAERTWDRKGAYTVESFGSVLDPMFLRIKKADLQNPGASPTALFELMRKASISAFTISKG